MFLSFDFPKLLIVIPSTFILKQHSLPPPPKCHSRNAISVGNKGKENHPLSIIQRSLICHIQFEFTNIITNICTTKIASANTTRKGAFTRRQLKY